MPADHDQRHEFDAEFGQSLCDLFQRELGYGCIFAGPGGVIVAASVRERIGTVHDMAARIMAGDMEDHAVTRAEAARSKGMREGLNLAIDFQGRRVISIGIAGPLDQVAPLARIARFCTVSLLRAQTLERSLGQQEAVARRLAALSEHLTRESTATMATVKQDMAALNESVGQITMALEEMHRESGVAASASTRTSETVAEVVGSGRHLAASIGRIERTVDEVQGVVTAAVEQSRRTEANVQGLFEAAGRIGHVVKLINDIANQTNLLALNATIEAARAGDAGKGFAVVAAEVKALARQSAQATGEIAGQVETIRAATTEAVAAIGGINTTISQVNRLTGAVADAVRQQTSDTANINQGAETASSGAGEVAAVNARVSERAEAVTRLIGTVGGRVTQLGQHLEDLFARLSGIMAEAEAAQLTTGR